LIARNATSLCAMLLSLLMLTDTVRVNWSRETEQPVITPFTSWWLP